MTSSSVSRAKLSSTHLRIIAPIAAALLLIGNGRPSAADFAIQDGDVVAFLGDSITAARTYGRIIENYTLLRYPNRKVKFINVGRGGETAAGGLKRLEDDVFSQSVTLLTVAYGINDIGWGMRADDEHRQIYLDAIRGIVEACRERGVRVYICSAAVTGADPAKTENDFLQQMCDAGLEVARKYGGNTIDVQRTMREIQRRVSKANESADGDEKFSLHTDDTIHLNDLGQLAMAFAILKGLGAPSEVSAVTLDAASQETIIADGCEVSDVRFRPDRIEFTRLDEGLPFNNGVFSSLNYRFVPIPQELNRYMLTVKNLQEGDYRLVVAGREVGTFSGKRLEAGVNISSATADPWAPGGPWDAQADLLRALSEAREDTHEVLRKTPELLGESGLANSTLEEASQIYSKLLSLQRSLGQPRPYHFVLTRVEPPAKDQKETERAASREKRPESLSDKPTAAAWPNAEAPNNESAADEAIKLLSPLELQVFQRRDRTSGPVLISGRTPDDCDRVEVRFGGSPLEGALPTEWQAVTFSRDANQFNEVLTLPAGGWYTMEIRALKDGKTLAEKRLDKIGVGEVFVGAGQSNSTNCGEFRTEQTSGMVSSFGGKSWQLANDPQPGVADRSEGGSFWPAFGDAMYQRYQVPIGVATTGFGGTSVNQWQPSEGLFKWTMARIEQLGPMGFRCLLWHQGESDVGMTSDEYYSKLKAVIEATRDQAAWEIPWVVAQVSYHNPEKPSFDSTRSAQKRLWDEKIALEGPDTDVLTGDHRDLGGAGIHFSPKGLKAHGEMWAEKVSHYLDEVLAERGAP